MVQGFGFRALGFGFRVNGFKPGFTSRVSDLEERSSWFRLQGQGFKGSGLGRRVQN